MFFWVECHNLPLYNLEIIRVVTNQLRSPLQIRGEKLRRNEQKKTEREAKKAKVRGGRASRMISQEGSAARTTATALAAGNSITRDSRCVAYRALLSFPIYCAR